MTPRQKSIHEQQSPIDFRFCGHDTKSTTRLVLPARQASTGRSDPMPCRCASLQVLAAPGCRWIPAFAGMTQKVQHALSCLRGRHPLGVAILCPAAQMDRKMGQGQVLLRSFRYGKTAQLKQKPTLGASLMQYLQQSVVKNFKIKLIGCTMD